MDSVSISNTNKDVSDQQQSSSQRHGATSPKRSFSEYTADLASVASIHARRRPAHIGRLHIDTQQLTPRHHQRTLCTGSCATKKTITTGTSIDVTSCRQWSQSMLDILQDLSIVLSPDGIIVWAPRTTKALLGYDPEKLVNKSMADLIRPDEEALFVQHLQDSMDQQADFFHYYHVRKADGDYSCLEVSGRPHYEEVMDPVSDARSHVPRGFFLSARPHPSRAAQALDTFFDIKKENETLRQQLKATGVRHVELSEIGILGETSLQTRSSVDSRGISAAGESEQEPKGSWKQSSPHQSSQHSSSPNERAQTSASSETTRTQTLQSQQQQQMHHQFTLHPHQQQEQDKQLNRDIPTAADTFVNAFLSTEVLFNDVSDAAGQVSHTLNAPHDTASFFLDVGGQGRAMHDVARPSSGHVIGADLQPAVHNPHNLSYSESARHRLLRTQDFYPFGSPEPFPYEVYGATDHTGSILEPGVSPQRSTPIPMRPQTSQQLQQTLLDSPLLPTSPRYQPTHLSHDRQNTESPDLRGLQTPHVLPGQALTGSKSDSLQAGSLTLLVQPQTKDVCAEFYQSSEKQARAAKLATGHSTITAQQQSSEQVHVKSPKRLKKIRAEGPEYVCTDCGTTDSPEWRRGPRGAKTLCNACGLRFAKLQKKASGAVKSVKVQRMGMHLITATRGHARRPSASAISSKFSQRDVFAI